MAIGQMSRKFRHWIAIKSRKTGLDLKALAAQLVAVRTKILAAGGFLHDRELHQCPACGLMEDVLISGKLVTYWRQSPSPLTRDYVSKKWGPVSCPALFALACPLSLNLEGAHAVGVDALDTLPPAANRRLLSHPPRDWRSSIWRCPCPHPKDAARCLICRRKSF
jgi:hypothetical protein